MLFQLAFASCFGLLMNKFVLLGYITKTFGLKGGVCVNLFNASSESLKPGMPLKIKLKKGKDEKNFIIENFLKPNRLFLSGISDKDQAETLRESEIYLHENDLPTLSDDEYYLEQIKDFKIFEDDKEIGKIVAFSSNGPQILIEVLTNVGHVSLVPLVKPLIKEIDFDAGKIVFDSILGLFDPLS